MIIFNFYVSVSIYISHFNILDHSSGLIIFTRYIGNHIKVRSWLNSIFPVHMNNKYSDHKSDMNKIIICDGLFSIDTASTNTKNLWTLWSHNGNQMDMSQVSDFHVRQMQRDTFKSTNINRAWNFWYQVIWRPHRRSINSYLHGQYSVPNSQK
jgi:hypothetical protein